MFEPVAALWSLANPLAFSHLPFPASKSVAARIYEFTPTSHVRLKTQMAVTLLTAPRKKKLVNSKTRRRA